MPRSRNIKPGFFTNDELAEHNSTLGRLFFIGLWCHCDYKGDVEWRPSKLKAQILPYDNCDVTEIAINLDKSRFIMFYSHQGKIYLRVNNFTKHQNPHPNERKAGSDIPEFNKEGRQLIDFTTLTINRDLSRSDNEDSISNPADSLILIPDSLILIPDSANRDYAHDFANVWNMFTGKFGEKGAKAKAKAQYMKLKPNDDLYFEIENAIYRQIQDKTEKLENGDFYQSFPHVERWIRDKRWTDEIVKPITTAKQSGSAKSDAALRSYLSAQPGGNGEDVASFRGLQLGVHESR